MISINTAIALVCLALLAASGATLAVCRFGLAWEPRRAALGLQEASADELEAELRVARAEEEGASVVPAPAPLAEVHAMRAGPALAIAPAVHPGRVIRGEVEASHDWAPTDRLKAWARTGAPKKSPGLSGPNSAKPARAAVVTGPGGAPRPRVMLAQFRSGLDTAMREFDARMDAIMRAA